MQSIDISLLYRYASFISFKIVLKERVGDYYGSSVKFLYISILGH